MKTLLMGDRVGGVMFDVQQACEKYKRIPEEVLDQMVDHLVAAPDVRSAARNKLIQIAAQTVMLIVQLDMENRVCGNTEHDSYGKRMIDCSECNAANPRIGECGPAPDTSLRCCYIEGENLRCTLVIGHERSGYNDSHVMGAFDGSGRSCALHGLPLFPKNGRCLDYGKP